MPQPLPAMSGCATRPAIWPASALAGVPPDPGATPGGASICPAPALAGKLLYVEDEPVCVELLRGMLLTFPDVELLHAADGLSGVAMARSHRPDMVLLDMHLPDIGGAEVMRRLNDDIGVRGLRVTILTGDELNMDLIKAMSLGAYEYWLKPLRPAVLREGLRRALTGKTPDPAHTLVTRQRFAVE